MCHRNDSMYYYNEIDMKNQTGKTYKQISDETGISMSYIAKYFAGLPCSDKVKAKLDKWNSVPAIQLDFLKSESLSSLSRELGISEQLLRAYRDGRCRPKGVNYLIIQKYLSYGK